MTKLTIIQPKVRTPHVDYYREVVVLRRSRRTGSDKLMVTIRLDPEALKDMDSIRGLLEEPFLRQSGALESASHREHSFSKGDAFEEGEVEEPQRFEHFQSAEEAPSSVVTSLLTSAKSQTAARSPAREAIGSFVDGNTEKSSTERSSLETSELRTPSTPYIRAPFTEEWSVQSAKRPVLHKASHPVSVLACQMAPPEIIVISDDDLVEEDSDSELSSLDAELNKTLLSSTMLSPPGTAPAGKDIPTQVDPTENIDGASRSKEVKYEKLTVEEIDHRLKSTTIDEWTRLRLENDKKDLEVQTKYPGYKRVPPNLHSMLYREFVLLFEDAEDDNDDGDFSMIEKVVFSLKDPYSSRKIHVPVKATICRHFECFDFDTFCEYHKVPMIIKKQLKKDLVSRRLEVKEKTLLLEKHLRKNGGKLPLNYSPLSKSEQVYHFNVYNKTPPLYKCPICDQKFGIKQLYISDLFNYFVKMSPKEAARVELIDKDRYRVMDDSAVPQSLSPVPGKSTEEIFEVLELDEESSKEAEHSLDDLNDGQDEAILGLAVPPAGSWDDPVTID